MWSIMLPWYFKNIKLTRGQENIRKMTKSCSTSAAAGGTFTLYCWRENFNLACTVSLFLCHLYAVVNCAKKYSNKSLVVLV